MDKRISATRAVREFSRGGKPVACMASVQEMGAAKTLGDLKAMLKRLPRLNDELDALATDLEDIRNDQPLTATGSP